VAAMMCHGPGVGVETPPLAPVAVALPVVVLAQAARAGLERQEARPTARGPGALADSSDLATPLSRPGLSLT
jgi:hypothetical protein